MIDTIKLFIPISEIDQNKVAPLLKNHQIKDGEKLQIKWLNRSYPLGSFSYEINFFIPPLLPYGMYCEFSIPKYINGENIHLINHKQVLEALQTFYQQLKNIFPDIDIPKYENIEIHRLDLCHCWKTTQEIINEYLDYYQRLDNKKNKNYNYESSVMWVNRLSSIKFYDKEKEFYKNDFCKIKKLSYEKAQNLLHEAQGILRFEVTIRKQQLEYDFKNNLKIDNILQDFDKLYNIINKYLSSVTGLKGELMDNEEVKNKLINTYGKRKGIRLTQFYSYYFNKEAKGRKALLENLSKVTIWKNKKDLKQAGIGSPKLAKIDKDFLVIPQWD